MGMRVIFSLFLLLAASVLTHALPVVLGTTTAIVGQQAVFSVKNAPETWTWCALPPDGDITSVHRGNQDKPAFVTTWAGGRGGTWHIWVESGPIKSNVLAVQVVNSGAGDTGVSVPNPNDVIPWSESIQPTPKGALSDQLKSLSATPARSRVIPSLPGASAAQNAPAPATGGSAAATPTPATPISPAVPLGAPCATPEGGGVTEEDSSPIRLLPTGENIIDLAAQLIEPESPGSLRNPFVRAKALAPKPRDFSMSLSAVVLGPRPAAVLNEKVYSAHDIVEGTSFRVTEIQRDFVVLQTGRYFLQLPIDIPTIIRLPQ